MSSVYGKLINSNNASNGFYYAFEYANNNPGGLVGTEQLHNLATELEKTNEVYADTHDIAHGLSEDDMRILHKILARDYPTDTGVGRKRGAILRYIKYFRETQHTPKGVTGKQLHRYLKRNG